MTHKAKKVVIVTERLLLDRLATLVERCGGTGYTVVSAGGKGSRGVRAPDRTNLVDGFANIRMEVVAAEPVARRIAEEAAAAFFEDYPGIAFLEDVEVLRPHKFGG